MTVPLLIIAHAMIIKASLFCENYVELPNADLNKRGILSSIIITTDICALVSHCQFSVEHRLNKCNLYSVLFQGNNQFYNQLSSV